MAQFGDPIDPEFSPDEQLYLRVSPDNYVIGATQALLSHIRFPTFSVNRGKYSAPIDAIASNYAGWAVAGFLVRDIPARLESPSQGMNPGKAFLFAPEHYPENGNYAHSHVCSRTEQGDAAEPSKTVKTTFRELLRQKLTFLIAPQ